MSTTPDLGIPEIATQQAQPEVTHNEALVMLQLLLNGVIDQRNTPPGSPTDGDSYLIGASPSGAWIGRANNLAIWWSGSWRYVPGTDDSGTPITMGARQKGLHVWVRDDGGAGGSNPGGSLAVWNGTSWEFITSTRVDD